MLKYLVIQLDDTGTSYCHYENRKSERRLISLADLRKGIIFAKKENLMIQFIYPSYELPYEYKSLIDTVNHSSIVPSDSVDDEAKRNADVIVFNGWDDVDSFELRDGSVCAVRTGKNDFFEKYSILKSLLGKVARVNLILTDVDTFSEEDFEKYKAVLDDLSDEVAKLYSEGKFPQFNMLTDRILLNEMNNCNAGGENITLAPDGKFYVCPAFYLADEADDYGLGRIKFSIGDIENGLDIKNPQLYKLSHAPICRNCDAYQCKRCVWLNRKTTYEVNTPGHEQCVISHLERNASRKLLAKIRSHRGYLPQQEIREIDYLDPFEIRKDW